MQKKSKKRGVFSSVVRTVLLVAAAALTLFIVFFAVKLFSLDAWNSFDASKILDAEQTLIIYDGADAEITRLDAGEDRVWTPFEEIPVHVQRAFISAEDARYYEHPGIDIIRIFGAAWEDIKAGGYVQGASTITQQLIKLSHLTNEKTISRKLQEAVLAYQIEKQFSKEKILEMYLNYVYFGRGYYGLEAAALGYFGVHASELTLSQGAALAGILKSPSKYSPHIAPDACRSRRNNILALMRDYGYIDPDVCEAAKGEPLTVQPVAEVRRGYYVDAALTEAIDALDIDMETLLTGGYRIYTRADMGLQTHCEALFEGDELFPSGDCEGAVAIIRAGDSSVAALVGGRSTQTVMAFNRASDIRRQPGSVIKPVLVYAPALEAGEYTAASSILDERTSFADYSPRNFNDKYYGWVTLREAVKRSLNVPAVKLMAKIGVDECKAFAQRLGVEFDAGDTSLTLALGGFSYGVSPLQMAGAYACFANGGDYAEPYLVERITDSTGAIVYEHAPDASRVMSEENAFILTSMLQSAISEGTGRRLGELGLGLAGKTGTVGGEESNRDAWMAAYSPEYSACVWLGYDSSSEGALPADATGGKYPALMLSQVFSYLYPDGVAPQFTAPAGVSEVKLDAHTLRSAHVAVRANAFTPDADALREYFAAGTEPGEVTSYWTVPTAARLFNVKINAAGYPIISFTAPDGNAIYRLYRADAYGNTLEIASWQGGGGRLEHEDASVPNGAYTYFVIPEHEKLVINGRKVEGARSASVTVTVARALDIEDTEFDDEDPLDEEEGEDNENIR